MGRELDDIARELARGEISRRGALKRLIGAGAGVGALFGPASLSDALAGGRCRNGRVRCKGKCCPRGARCKRGRCRCPKGSVKCNGRCCPKGARCRNGRCRCPRGTKKCNGRCIDFSSSLRHCGACGNACADGQVCADGVCTTPECEPGQTEPCYSGPEGTEGVGACIGGTSTCGPDHTWGPCEGEVTPRPERCDEIDHDCDGNPYNGFEQLGAPCDGPDSDLCMEGVFVCNEAGDELVCSDQTGDTLEVPANGIDDDCNPETPD